MTLADVRTILFAVLLTSLIAVVAQADVPLGWTVAGSSPRDYEFSRDASAAASGKYSALIAARGGVALAGFGTLMQTINAENYRGGRWKLSGSLKTIDATRAQMWMRVDGPDRKVLAFDNMDSRPVTGSTGWARFEIVLDVPTDSVDIAFGFLLTQGGKVWGDDFRLEKVGTTVPVTSVAARTVLPKEPVNADFESVADATFSADNVDISDIYRANGRLGPHTVEAYNLCGMHAIAKARAADGTTHEWDLKLSVMLDGTTRVGIIAAGAFTVRPHASSREPSRPITALAIRLDGMGESASARIVGPPNSVGGVVGEFPESYAEKLFDAFDAGTPFTVDVTYDSGEREAVNARTLGGIGETGGHKFHGIDAPVRRCLGLLAPPSKSGLKQPIVDKYHLS